VLHHQKAVTAVTTKRSYNIAKNRLLANSKTVICDIKTLCHWLSEELINLLNSILLGVNSSPLDLLDLFIHKPDLIYVATHLHSHTQNMGMSYG